MWKLPPYATLPGKLGYYAFLAFCGLIFMFLVLPVLIVLPLSFNSEPYFTYPMHGFSLRWYQDILDNEMWIVSTKNSIIVGLGSTALSVLLGTLTALGLNKPGLPFKKLTTGILISPMIVPLVITGVGMYIFYAKHDLTGNLLGIITAHTVIGTPFVIIFVNAALAGFNSNITRAGQSLGASPTYVFFKITLPLIMPGIIYGGMLAFVSSLDELVIVMFLAGVEERTIPMQMWTGLREQLSPSVLAVATILMTLLVGLLIALELLRRRRERYHLISTK